jgi:hypothetical protein
MKLTTKGSMLHLSLESSAQADAETAGATKVEFAKVEFGMTTATSGDGA